MAAAFIMTIIMTDVTVRLNISNMAAAIIMTIIMTIITTKATIIISAIHLGRAGCFMRAAALPGAEAGLAFG